ncbi:MAG: glycoside hydrolase family 73 protein [Saprospiraceae bacterium]
MKKLFISNFNKVSQAFTKHWIKVAGLLCIAYLLTHKDLSFQMKMNASETFAAHATNEDQPSWKERFNNWSHRTAQSLLNGMQELQGAENLSLAQKRATLDLNLANTYSNMGFGELGQKNAPSISKKRKKEAYIKRFAKVAQAEMRKYGIPASIILAQGLIETNAGESRLSTKNNNHFGMKCFSKKCKKNHCSNFTDDSHKDFFRIYNNAWESYRAHSLLLQGKRYRHLSKLARTDYKNWAKGLKKAGYATDPKYAIKLIRLIESLKLYRYDQ